MTREREYYIDWLRVLAVTLLVPFHTGCIFALWGFHIKNEAQSLGLTVFNAFLGVWHMPLLFLLSGVGSWFALGFRSGGQYVGERVRRLFIPLVFGILVIVPPQTYFERVQKAQFEGTYLQFYPHVFNGFYPEGNFTWNHLWFLVYLFTFSLIAVRFFVSCRAERGKPTVDKMVAFFTTPGRLLLLALPLMVVEATLRVRFPGLQTLVTDWANFFYYLTAFIYGFFLCSRRELSDAVARFRYLFLGLAVAGFLSLTAIVLTDHEPEWSYNPARMAFEAAGAFVSWCWVLTILGFGKKHLNFRNRLLTYATEAVLPCYVIHQTIIIVIGFYVVQWQAGIAAKFAIINVMSFVFILVLYEGVIRRVNVLRFLFGMKRRPPKTA